MFTLYSTVHALRGTFAQNPRRTSAFAAALDEKTCKVCSGDASLYQVISDTSLVSGKLQGTKRAQQSALVCDHAKHVPYCIKTHAAPPLCDNN